ncbi:hypothetical protein AMECASPLE_005298 [Ameca splendens]|uniref:Uncharacterized protein n=1 Tax=Ameca splendens TaxID=208324 RepID=A0ABV0ZVP8_9TELE
MLRTRYRYTTPHINSLCDNFEAFHQKGPTMEEKLGEKKKNQTQRSPDLTSWTIPPALRGQNDIFNYDKRIAELKTDVTMFTKKIKELEKVIRPLETEVNCNQRFCDREIYNIQQFMTRIERKPLDAKILFEKAIKLKQEISVTLEKMLRERMTLKSEFEKVEYILNKHKCYGDILFKLSPPDWQEAKEAEILKAKNAQKESNPELEETANSKCVEAAQKSSPGGTLPLESKLSMLKFTESVVLSDSEGNEKIMDIYFSDPSEVVVLPSELTDQILSLIENATEMDEMLERTLEITTNKMKEDEKKLTMQENNMKSRTEMEKKRAVVLKKQVQLHKSLKSQDQDIMLEALGRKVTEVHSCFSESRLINLATLEKLCSVEYRMTLLLQQIEYIPADMFQTLWQIRDGEKKSRLQEERLRQERQKQKEKLDKCLKRALGESKKITGRKLMPRCIPVQKKVQVNVESSAPVEEDPHAEVFKEGCDSILNTYI